MIVFFICFDPNIWPHLYLEWGREKNSVALLFVWKHYVNKIKYVKWFPTNKKLFSKSAHNYFFFLLLTVSNRNFYESSSTASSIGSSVLRSFVTFRIELLDLSQTHDQATPNLLWSSRQWFLVAHPQYRFLKRWRIKYSRWKLI